MSLTFTHILASTRSATCIRFSPPDPMAALRAQVFVDGTDHTRVPALLQSRSMCRSHALSCGRKAKKVSRPLPRTPLLLIFHVSLSPVFIGTFHFGSHRAPRWCNPIPARWRMHCFKAALLKLYVSLGERHASVMYAFLENRRRAKPNAS